MLQILRREGSETLPAPLRVFDRRIQDFGAFPVAFGAAGPEEICPERGKNSAQLYWKRRDSLLDWLRFPEQAH